MNKKYKKAFILFFIFFLFPLLFPFQVVGDTQDISTNANLNTAFQNLVSVRIKDFHDLNNDVHLSPLEGQRTPFATFTGDFPRFSASVSNPVPDSTTDLGVVIVPYILDAGETLANGTVLTEPMEIQVRGYLKQYTINYSLTFQTQVSENYIQHETYFEDVPLYSEYHKWWFAGGYHSYPQLTYNVKIPTTSYQSDYKTIAARNVFGNLRLEFILDPGKAFINGDEHLSFIQNFNKIEDYITKIEPPMSQEEIKALISAAFPSKEIFERIYNEVKLPIK